MPHDMVTRGLVLRAIHESMRSVDFVASTDAVDAYGDIVEQSWLLDRYRSNPVILFAHDSRSLPIGQATRVEVVNGQLEMTATFATAEANPLAEQVWQSIKQKTLRAVSVGFIPNEVRLEKREGQDVYVLAQNELHEISVVPIPANPEALAKMRARAAATTRDVPGRLPADAENQAREREENEMNLEEAKALLAQREADLTKERAAVEATRTELTNTKAALAAAEASVKVLGDERNALADRCKAVEAEVVKHEVEALIGKKLLPAERETAIELATTNLALFRKQMAARPELKLLGAPVVEQEKKGSEPKPTTGAGNGEELAEKLNEALYQNGGV